MYCSFFFFNDTATTEIYTLSLHDALPIFVATGVVTHGEEAAELDHSEQLGHWWISFLTVQPVSDELKARTESSVRDRKSTRLNSSHANISYAVFCLKKKNILIYSYIFTYH